MKPYLQDADFTLYCGDSREVLSTLPAESVHMAVTSPPFFGLRDYGVDSQIGLEATVDEWVDSLVGVFREVRRVMRHDATLFIECGDSYQDKQLLRQPFRLAEALQQPYYAGQIKSELDRVWLAATVEAEGCLFIHRRKAGQSNGQGYERKSDSFGAGLEVSSTDRVVVERCMAIAGFGSICEQTPKQNDRRKQTLYRWNARTNESRRVIAELYPHLIAKQHEARLLIGCPSSGPKAAAAHESLKALHQGGEATIDFPAPASLYEPGMYLRNVCIFHRPNPMPESVRDRFTVSHSYVLLFSKSPRYFFDAEAVRETFSENTHSRGTSIGPKNEQEAEGGTQHAGRSNASFGRAILANLDNNKQPPQTETLDGSEGEAPRGPDGRRKTAHDHAVDSSHENHKGMGERERWPNSGRNARSVWTIATEPLPFEHYAAFPQALAERCIKAGTSERGCCPECGAPWEREVESTLEVGPNCRVPPDRFRADLEKSGGTGGQSQSSNRVRDGHVPGLIRTAKTLGWSPSCECNQLDAFVPIPCTVLDPFLGSGTTALVSRRLGRRCIGVELNERYCELAAKRTQQLSLEVA